MQYRLAFCYNKDNTYYFGIIDNIKCQFNFAAYYLRFVYYMPPKRM